MDSTVFSLLKLRVLMAPKSCNFSIVLLHIVWQVTYHHSFNVEGISCFRLSADHLRKIHSRLTEECGRTVRVHIKDDNNESLLLPRLLLLLLLSTPIHQRAASRVQHPNHVAANSLSPQVARKGSTLSGFVQRSRLEREVGWDLHSNKWEEV